VEHAEVSFYSLSILAFQLANQMNVNRRKLLQLAGAAAAAPVFPRPASALDYPTRPVRLIVGYVAGGPNDIVARIVGQSLSERLGQPFVIVNHPGAASNLAAQEVVRSTADGYTLLFVNASNAINATLYEKLNFNFINDIEPVAGIIRVPNVVEVNLNVPAHSIPEFIDYAKANPGKVNMGSGGIGTTVHMAGELFKMMTGINMVHVPYRGAAPALVDLMAGRLQVMFDAMPNSIGYIKAGRLRALAVTTLTRSKTLPDLPTVASFVPGYEAKLVVRHRRAQGYAYGDHHQAQYRGKCGSCGSHDEGAPRRSRRNRACRLARGFWQVDCRRNRKMGKGCSVLRRQSELNSPTPRWRERQARRDEKRRISFAV